MRKFLIPAGALVLIAAASSYWFLSGGSTQAVSFRTEQATRGELLASISSTGTLEPEDVIDVGSQVAGLIKEFGTGADGKPIDYGSPVEAGTVLAKIDDSLFRAKVDQSEALANSARSRVSQAKAKVDQAKANTARSKADLLSSKAKANQSSRDWDRAKLAWDAGTLSRAEYDAAQAVFESNNAAVAVAEAAITQAVASEADAAAAVADAEAAVKTAEATLQQDKINLGYCTIISPVKGVIIDRRVTLGQTVQSSFNTPSLFLIAKDLKRMKVWASVNEADISQVRVDQPVRFTVDAYPNRTFLGKVGRIRYNATNTQNVVVYTVEVVTDNPDGQLLPYMTANLQFEVDRRTDALLVPNSALRFKPSPQATGGNRPEAGPEKPGQGVVWVEENGKVRPVTVQLGLTDGNQTEVLGGEIQPGMKLVVSENRGKASSSTDATNPFAPPKASGGKKG
jgi:HlyD family secretion protein